jgi:N-acetylglucosaminyldiphosphoundecaprenol N-acetyl-beta-D-mannosaminyltransferase
VDRVESHIVARTPSYFITANVHYAMLTAKDPTLAEINARAAFITADGAPLVWASRRRPTPLPQRVAGSDLIFELCERASIRGHRLYFLGGAEGVASEAARRLEARYPGLQVVGVEAPPFRRLSPEEHNALLSRIREAQPDILLVAFGQPKGERWIAENLELLGVPVCAQVGASLDFAAGRVRRAPYWMQRSGLEWSYRLWLEPRRLFGRYASNAWFLSRMIVQDMKRRPNSKGSGAGLFATSSAASRSPFGQGASGEPIQSDAGPYASPR